MARGRRGGLCGSTHCDGLTVSGNPQLVPYESIAGTEDARLMRFDGVDTRFGRAIEAETLLGNDGDRVIGVCLVFVGVHGFLVLLREGVRVCSALRLDSVPH